MTTGCMIAGLCIPLLIGQVITQVSHVIGLLSGGWSTCYYNLSSTGDNYN